jgi:hypothetical protein
MELLRSVRDECADDLMMTGLCVAVDSAVAPLRKGLMEREGEGPPLCGKISFVIQEGMPGVHYVHLEVRRPLDLT